MNDEEKAFDEFVKHLRKHGFELIDEGGLLFVTELPKEPEVSLFVNTCPMHFPSTTLILAGHDNESVGYLQMDHDTKFDGSGHKKFVTNPTQTYRRMCKRLVEQDWTMVYRGPRRNE